MSKKNGISVEQRADIVRTVNVLADEMLDFCADTSDKLYFLLDAVHPYLKSLPRDEETGIGPGSVEEDRREAELMARVTPALRKAIVDVFTEASLDLASPVSVTASTTPMTAGR